MKDKILEKIKNYFKKESETEPGNYYYEGHDYDEIDGQYKLEELADEIMELLAIGDTGNNHDL